MSLASISMLRRIMSSVARCSAGFVSLRPYYVPQGGNVQFNINFLKDDATSVGAQQVTVANNQRAYFSLPSGTTGFTADWTPQAGMIVDGCLELAST